MPSAYCVKCKKSVEIKNPTKATIGKRNQPALKGTCGSCSTRVCKIVSRTNDS